MVNYCTDLTIEGSTDVGSLCIKSNPSGASIYIRNSNSPSGKTTISDYANCNDQTIININVGVNYDYKLTKSGYDNKVGKFNITKDTLTKIDAGNLTPNTSKWICSNGVCTQASNGNHDTYDACIANCSTLTHLECDNTTKKCKSVSGGGGNKDGCTSLSQSCGGVSSHLKCSGSPNYKCISVSGEGNNEDGCTSLNQLCGGVLSHLECDKTTKKCISISKEGTNKNNCVKVGDICTPCFKEIPLIGCMSESTYKTIKWSAIGFGVLISGTLLYRIYKNIKG